MKRLLVASVAAAMALFAQLPAPNAAGVTAGHHIFVVKNLEASNQFWDALGAGRGTLGPLNLVKFPGVLFLIRQGDNSGGTEGSSVNYLGFKVKDLKATLAKLDAIGVKPLAGATAMQAFVMAPDQIKVHLTEDKALATSVASDEAHMAVPNPVEAEAWYAKYFGTNIPGARVTFEQAKGPVAGTKGRALDRLGFEVKDLATVVEKLKGSGAQMNGNVNKAKNMDLSVSILTDPWGTYIELSQGLAAVK